MIFRELPAVSDLLFVYGSLMPELLRAPFGIDQRLRLAAESQPLGRATLPASLYHLGDYPGLVVPPDNASDVVHGTLLRLSNPDATFQWLDNYEDFDPARYERENLYQRRILQVALTETPENAWVYIMRRVPPGSHRIPSGMWHAPSLQP
jgi:gamma-glutamylcyclotransferase (GGCT)/AIG2-like uncharacterized protein YtfP